MTLKDLFTWKYVEGHWLGILVVIISTIIILWLLAGGRTKAKVGPVSYAIEKHTWIFFLIGLLTFVAVVLIIAYVGPSLIKFSVWGLDKAVGNSEAVVIGATKAPTTTTNQSNPLASATPGVSQALTGDAQLYCTTIAATVRSGPSSTATSLGDITANTTIKLGQIVDSNCVDNVCQRGQLTEAVGSFPIGSWIHLAAATAGTCP